MLRVFLKPHARWRTGFARDAAVLDGGEIYGAAGSAKRSLRVALWVEKAAGWNLRKVTSGKLDAPSNIPKLPPAS